MTTTAAKRSDLNVLPMLRYALLKKDSEVLSKVSPGTQPPEPMLYDPATHQAHRNGQYRSLKPAQKRETIVLLPKQ